MSSGFAERLRNHSVFRALRYRNYRLFVMGQGVSLLGTWMQQVAMSWLVYRLTGSVWLLGAIGFCSQIPAFVLSPFAGVFADRWRKQAALLCAQTLMMVQAAVLAVLVLSGNVKVWEIILLSIFAGSVNAFEIPVRQSFFIDMIENRDDLANAIALNSSLFSGARLVGPAIAGATIAVVGEGICFLLNSVSFLAVLLALAMIKVDVKETATNRNPVFHELREGIEYAYGFVPMRVILAMLVLVSLFGMPYAVLMPVFAKKVFHGGANTYGVLMTMSGAGALAGAVYLATRKSVLGLWKVMGVAVAVFGASIMAFAFCKTLWVSLVFSFIAGMATTTLIASSNTILQTIVDNDKRGRVMSLYSMAFMGAIPFGSLLAGALADTIGAPDTLFFSGALCFVGSVFFALKFSAVRKMVRPVYERIGILPTSKY
jgi:MFS family permease